MSVLSCCYGFASSSPDDPTKRRITPKVIIKTPGDPGRMYEGVTVAG